MAVADECGAGVDGGSSVEVREPPTSLFDQDLARRQVPWLQVELGVDLRLAGGDERVAEIVAEAALAQRAVDQSCEAVPPARLADDAEPRMQERRLLERARRRHTDALAIQECAAAAPGRVHLVGDRIVDDTGRDLSRLLEADQRGPHRDAADEVPRAVDRVDDPPAVLGASRAELLAEEPAVRKRGAEDL